jgi:hypothetical protein
VPLEASPAGCIVNRWYKDENEFCSDKEAICDLFDGDSIMTVYPPSPGYLVRKFAPLGATVFLGDILCSFTKQEPASPAEEDHEEISLRQFPGDARNTTQRTSTREQEREEALRELQSLFSVEGLNQTYQKPLQVEREGIEQARHEYQQQQQVPRPKQSHNTESNNQKAKEFFEQANPFLFGSVKKNGQTKAEEPEALQNRPPPGSPPASSHRMMDEIFKRDKTPTSYAQPSQEEDLEALLKHLPEMRTFPGRQETPSKKQIHTNSREAGYRFREERPTVDRASILESQGQMKAASWREQLKDHLQVRAQISDIQTQIESLYGQLSVLLTKQQSFIWTLQSRLEEEIQLRQQQEERLKMQKTLNESLQRGIRELEVELSHSLSTSPPSFKLKEKK